MPAPERFPLSVDSDPGPTEVRGAGPLDRLVPASRLPERARLRVGVGAAIVLLLAALVITVVVSAVGQQSGSQVLAAANTTDAAGTLGSAGRASPASIAATGGPLDGGDGASGAGPIIFVHVLGAVERPGLFELPGGARVIDAIAAAGGLTGAADPAGANLARKLSDGEQLYLPQVGEVPVAPPPGASVGGTSTDAAGAVVNLNTATVADLDTLPRIGPAMAQRIVDYREANGPFAATEELRNITGIGDKTFDALKELVTV